MLSLEANCICSSVLSMYEVWRKSTLLMLEAAEVTEAKDARDTSEASLEVVERRRSEKGAGMLLLLLLPASWWWRRWWCVWMGWKPYILGEDGFVGVLRWMFVMCGGRLCWLLCVVDAFVGGDVASG